MNICTHYSIHKVQQEQLAIHGFLLLPQAIPQTVMHAWCDLTDPSRDQLKDILDLAWQEGMAHSIDTRDGRLWTRLNNLLRYFPEEVLTLLATPALVAIASELCGKGTVPLHCDLQWKHPHKESVVLWHQDALYDRQYPYYNIGIYLDDADAGDGCLRYVPGTQHEPQDICSMVKGNGWNIPGATDQPAHAGDILIQDMMVLHGSPTRKTPGSRRTIYVEMRPAEAVRDHGIQSAAWVRSRQQWMALVKQRYPAAGWPEDLSDGLEDVSGDQNDLIRRICHASSPSIPAVYCREDVSVGDYPYPERWK